jgi:hypothetical protein
MSNKQNDELDEQSREQNEEALSDAIRISRYEPGVPIETVAEIFFVHYDQAETRALIDELIKIQSRKYGERLFQ